MKTKNKFLFPFLLFCALTINCKSQTTSNIQTYEKLYTDSVYAGGYDRMLIYTEGSKVRAYYYVYFDSMGGRKSCLTGQIKGSLITGTSFVFLGNEYGELYGIDQHNFKIEMSADKSKINYRLNIIQDEEGTEMKLSDFKYSFWGGISNFRELPNKKSKILSKEDLLKANIELIAIGNFEKIGKTSDFWYKVRIKNVEGWIFGGLDLSKNQ